MSSTENSSLLDLFRSKQALLEGHFLLSSGLHSDRYFQSALLLQDPKTAEQLAKLIAEKFPDKVQTILSPAIGGLVIGHEVARAKGARFIFSEKTADGKPSLRRGFQISEGESILVIEDVITTGLSTAEVMNFVQNANANLIGIGSIVLRSKEAVTNLSKFGKPIKPLLKLEVQTWAAPNCPLCKKNIPVVKPGSRKQ